MITLINLFIYLIIMITTTTIILKEKNIFMIGCFYSIIWSALLTLMLFVTPDYEMNAITLIWIYIMNNIVYFTSKLNIRKSNYYKTDRNVFIDEKTIKRIVYLTVMLSIVGMGAPIVSIYAEGYSILDLLSIDNIYAIARHFTILRYGFDDYTPPLLHTFLTIFIYTGSLTGGIAFYLSKKPIHKLLSFSSFVPAILTLSILTTKASVLFPGAFWLSSYLSFSIYYSGKIQLFTRKQFKLFFILFLFALSVYTYGHILRVGDFKYGVQTAIPRMLSAFLGSPSAFSMWFNSTDELFELIGFGSRIFSGPLGLFFNFDMPRFESVVVGSNSYLYQETTVHTLYRELIYDFSLLGSLIFMSIYGFISGLTYRKSKAKRINYVFILSAMYSIALLSFIGFPFKYTTIVAAWFLYAFLVKNILRKPVIF